MLHDVLGRLWVAHVWECDVLAEQRLTHRTTVGDGRGQGDGPWLISRAMWLLAPRFTDPELVALTNPGGLERWGYLRKGRPTRHAAAAALVLGPLGAEVDGRWAERFGADVVARARTALTALTVELGEPLWALPVIPSQTGFRTDPDGVAAAATEATARVPTAERDLSELMAGPLLRLTLAYEQLSRLGLPLVANLLRVLDEPCRVRDLPVVTGASKEALSAMLGFAERRELVDVEDRAARAGDKGHMVRSRHERLLAEATADWVGATAVESALAPILASERLAEGLTAPESSWRSVAPYRARTKAVLADPRAHLPRHPLVLHRGGYPDGS